MEKVYYTPSDPHSFGGLSRLNKRFKSVNKTKKWLSYQDTYTLHKVAVKKYPRSKTLVGGIDHQWTSDLFEISSIAKANDGYRYVLICIDVLSKYAWAIPLHNKKGSSVKAAFQLIIESSGKQPRTLQTDKGVEFFNYIVHSYFDSIGIKHFTTENNDIKASMAERFIRTIKQRIFRFFTYKRNKRFIDHLQSFVDSYNNTVHSTTKMAPIDVTKDDEFMLLQQMYNIPQYNNNKLFNIGDLVRISMNKIPFKKSYEAQWTEEVFKILKVEKTSPVTYRLCDLQNDMIKGTFYKQELQVIRVKPEKLYRIETVLKSRQRNGTVQYYVKWVGFPEKFNSWVRKDDVHL